MVAHQGLCLFHDERSPSFHVTPAKGYWHCFGCQEGGDVIDFVRKVDHPTFAEAVEKLAARIGDPTALRGGRLRPARQAQGIRTRLVEAHKAAAAFYAEQLGGPEAQLGRTFLKERDFDEAAAQRFGVGYAPNAWDGSRSTCVRRTSLTRNWSWAGWLFRESVGLTTDSVAAWCGPFGTFPVTS